MAKIRLFIAVPLPEDIKSSIAELLGGVKQVFRNVSNIRFVPREKWHFTITFLGYQEEIAVPVVGESLKESISAFSEKEIKEKPYVEFKKLIYGPPGRTPRMIWLTTTEETSEKLGALKVLLEDTLEKNGVRWRRELRPLQAHLTLARFLPTAKKKLPFINRVRSRPSDITSERSTRCPERSASNEVDKNYSRRFRVEKINLMRSTLEHGGAVYEMLSSVDL